ncbi:MAG TPA: hypothetical protein VIJ04_04635 [Xanthobacteraceae bacterium]
MFELGFTQLGIVGGIILAIGLYVMAEHSKVAGLWISYAGLMIVGAGAVIQLQKVLAQNEGPGAAPKPRPDYVFIVDGTVTNIAGQSPVASIVLKNTGQENADGLIWMAQFFFGEPKANPPFEKPINVSKQTLGPGQILSYQYTFDKWNPTWDDLISRNEAMFFAIGEVRYRDETGTEHIYPYKFISGGRFGLPSGIAPGKWGAAP